ncbi:MAG: CaiB/BaiF CoA transferase family protein [Candidatus Heimdallarchaeota archaeon]
MEQPLSDIKIIDLSQTLAGPFCSMLLADMGAEVIKIEVPNHGDGLRTWGPPFLGREGVYFLGFNRNKKSLTLNLKNEIGREIFIKLINKADILLENFRPGTMEKLGFSYENIKNTNPQLIYCRISGYGQSGPYRNRAGYDLITQGESGLMTITGSPDRPPGAKVGVAIVDLGTGMYAAQGILCALLAREKTGEGQVIDVSLFDSAISWMWQPIGSYLASGELPKRLGTVHPVAAPYQAFKTRDIYITIGCQTQNHWKKLCELLDIEELKDNPRFATLPKRVENREELSSILSKIFVTKEGEHWLKMLQDAGLPCAPVNTVDRIVSNPQVLHRQMLVEVDHPTAGKIKVPGIPIKLTKTPGSIRRPPPLLGEHSREVLEELGFDESTIEKFQEKGITTLFNASSIKSA